jgi:hypothetical protein
MDEVFTSQTKSTNSDFAFWGDHAFMGYYTGAAGFPPGTGSRGGVQIFDISRPEAPRLIRDFACDGAQNDPILWDRNGNGGRRPDALGRGHHHGERRVWCRAGGGRHPERLGGRPRLHDERQSGGSVHGHPAGEVRLYRLRRPHHHTLWPGELEETGKLLAYVSSYPLGAGPTCGDTEFQNMANPYDEDPGSPNSPLHSVIQVVEVPVANPAASRELRGPGGQTVQPEISYPGDPDGKQEWCEKGLCSPAFEPAAVACHDIVVHVEHRVAGGACAEQGQVWEIDENGLPDTENPMSVGDDEVSSGGTGQFPGAVDFFHSVMFDNDAETVNWVDESFGAGCPTMTTYNPRPWNPLGGAHKTGRMFFSDMEGNFLSEFHVGDRRPDPRPGEYCSAHMGMAVMGIERDLLVNAWYTGGVDVIDFTRPTRLREIAWNDPLRQSGSWSAYPYTGPLFKKGPGLPVYVSDGVTNNAQAQGMVVYRAQIQRPSRRGLVDHLNPQTMDHEMMGGGDDDDDDDDRGGGRGDDDDDDRGNGRGRDRDRDGDDDDD